MMRDDEMVQMMLVSVNNSAPARRPGSTMGHLLAIVRLWATKIGCHHFGIKCHYYQQQPVLLLIKSCLSHHCGPLQQLLKAKGPLCLTLR